VYVALEDFLILLLNWVTVDRVLSGSSPLLGPGFTLFFKRWTRLTNAAAALLRVALDVKLRGVPAHALERSTTQVPLGGSCLLRGPLRYTVMCHDCSKLYISAWAASLDSFPSAVDLLIPDPPLESIQSPPIRRGLLYKMQVSVCQAKMLRMALSLRCPAV
jgi:hypothetical protein